MWERCKSWFANNRAEVLTVGIALVVIGLAFAWWVIEANRWGSTAATASNKWSPNLLGDAFGVFSSALTALALIGVALTYTKESKQLALMREDFEETKIRAETERHEALVIDMVKNNVDLVAQQRSKHFESRSGQMFPDNDGIWKHLLSTQGLLVPLNTACSLMLQPDTRISPYTFEVLCIYVSSLLTDAEKQWIYDSVKMTYNKYDRSKCNYLFSIVFLHDLSREDRLSNSESFLATIIDDPPPTD